MSLPSIYVQETMRESQRNEAGLTPQQDLQRGVSTWVRILQERDKRGVSPALNDEQLLESVADTLR